MHRTANILAVGDELILGQRTDTNSARVAAELTARGVRVLQHTTEDDDRQRLALAISRLTADADLLVITGGLGPTADDLTRQALADAAGEELVTDETALDDLRAFYAARNRPMPETNAVQAQRPESAECLKNENGTAPGLFIRFNECDVIALPGPPSEMLPILHREFDTRLRTDAIIAARQLQTFGLGESNVAELLGDLMERGRDPLVGTTASGGIVSVRIRSERADSPDAAERALDDTERLVRERLGPIVFHAGPEDDALARVVLGLLGTRGETLATVESCTAGGLGARITDVPGASSAFVGGLITYSNALKTGLAGVPGALLDAHGAVSREVAVAMAEGGRERLGATHALAVTGIAGPNGGTLDKPVGTVWIALASEGQLTDARRFRITGDREQVRSRTAVVALGLLRLRLIDHDSALIWQLEP
ncbi:MAG: competence/damage-inducible protein A [Phycisphaerales bacterium JB040]